MAKLFFTEDEMRLYFNGGLKHKAYDETVKKACDLAVHADGLRPDEMLKQRRPSESAAILAYRLKIWEPITQPTWNKVITELMKIRRSSDWAVKYDDSKVPPKIVEDETLKQYCEEDYPRFGSVTNWAFESMLSLYAKDANAVVAVMPMEIPASQNEYVKPFAYQFDSVNVFDFKQDDFAVIKSTDTVIFSDPVTGAKSFGSVFFFITTMWIEKWQQTSTTSLYSLGWHYDHNIGKLPAWRVKGLVDRVLDDTVLYKSKLAAMKSRLNEMMREYTDMQAEVVQHVYTERWEFADECPVCKGEGKCKPAGYNTPPVTCDACGGTGGVKRNPYSAMVIKRGMAGDQQAPMPPAGLIEKDTAIVTIQDNRIDKHEFKALAAINLEYLASTPLNQSGTAKEVDRDPANTFCNSIAEDIVRNMDLVYQFTSDFRYILVVPDESDRHDMCPVIPVPEKFDLLSTAYLEDQIAKQKESKANPIIINAMEEEYVNKKFIGDPVLKQKVLLSIKLDPLSGLTEDDKMTRLSNKGITERTYIISSNIKDFIDRAIDEKGESFFKMKTADQKLLIQGYADEQIEEESAKADVIPLVPADGIPVNPNDPANIQQPGQQGNKTIPKPATAAA